MPNEDLQKVTSLPFDTSLEELTPSLKRSHNNDVPEPNAPPKKQRRRTSKTPVTGTVPTLPHTVGKVYVLGDTDNGLLGLDAGILQNIRKYTSECLGESNPAYDMGNASLPECKRICPLKTLDDKDIVDVYCGALCSIVITKDGKLYSWGVNDEGALGRSTPDDEDMAKPGLVENLEGVKIVKVACRETYMMALSDEGKLYCWGSFRDSDGAKHFTVKKEIQPLPVLFESFKNTVIVDIAACVNDCIALTNTGIVYFWGTGQCSPNRVLNRRTSARNPLRTLIPARAPLRNIKAIGSGSRHAFAISHDNELYAWGYNQNGQCGEAPQKGEMTIHVTQISSVNGLGSIKSASGGENHSTLLMDNGRVYSFGNAQNGQLGIGETSEIFVAHPVAPHMKPDSDAVIDTISDPAIDHISRICTFDDHVVSLTEGNDVYVWGSNTTDQIGGKKDTYFHPTVLYSAGRKFLRIASGSQHSVFLVLDAEESSN